MATITGSAGNDSISGSSGADTVYGGGGNDTVNAGAGNDAVLTGSGADSINGGDGHDGIDSGSGNDTVFGGNGYDQIYGGDGDDKLYGGNDYYDDIFGGAGNDTIYAGNSTDDWTYGGSGNDIIYSDQGDDKSIGDEGSDALYGGDGADTLDGGADDDTVSGGAGNDQLIGGVGSDTIYGGTGNDLAYGGAGNDIIRGEDGNDTLYGGDSNDTLDGGNNDDSIFGGAGADLIAGGSGSDVLTGGAGDDLLLGGTGADVFRFDESGGADTITDFDRTLVDGKTTDQLDVSDLRTLQGEPVRWSDVAVSDDGNGNAVLTFPEGEVVVLHGVSPENATGKQNMGRMGIPCFTKGTKIRTLTGERLVETLRAGDIVLTADRGPQPLLWVGKRRLTRCEMLRKPQLFPIRLRGALALPDLIVSRQHSVLIVHQGRQVLARAGHLADHGIKGAHQCLGAQNASYYHLFLAEHALLWSNDMLSESFYPGPVALQSLGGKNCLSLLRALPVLAKVLTGQQAVGAGYGPTVRPVLSRKAAANTAWAGVTQIENSVSLSDKLNQSPMVLQPSCLRAPARDFATESALRRLAEESGRQISGRSSEKCFSQGSLPDFCR